MLIETKLIKFENLTVCATDDDKRTTLYYQPKPHDCLE